YRAADPSPPTPLPRGERGGRVRRSSRRWLRQPQHLPDRHPAAQAVRLAESVMVIMAFQTIGAYPDRRPAVALPAVVDARDQHVTRPGARRRRVTGGAVEHAVALVVEAGVREPAVAVGLRGVAAPAGRPEALVRERHALPAATQPRRGVGRQAVGP